jgi:hypothetical protein
MPTAAQRPELAVGDEAAGEVHECFVDVGSSFPPDPQASEAVQPGKAPLHDTSVGAQSGAVQGAAAGDGGHDAAGADLVAVDVVVVTAVGEERVGFAPRSSDPAADRRDCVEQGQELGDVIAAAASQQDGKWGAVSVGDEVMLRVGTAPIDWRGPVWLPLSMLEPKPSSFGRFSHTMPVCRRGVGGAQAQVGL